MKEDGLSGESFALSCPARLVVEAGESVLLSCSATDVPEEGVRYGWESVSGDGLRLLSDAQALAPLFAAPLSGTGEEYAYRLTAMAAGVYRTATVTVSVEGASGEPVRAPVVREECDPFTVPDELGEGCVEDKGPAPFGFDPESEGGFLFPEAPGPPDRPSGPVRGGGFDSQTPPRLECPVAVFLEELETGVIECHVSDAAGEEFLEYSWESVGGTTRDYLDNPRLIPEDSPTPVVVAPEAPVYETLESFRSGETTFLYRYRLTAISRATGLSSSSEVEVFVSSSRPGVYCPLEVVVEEGETAQLDCEGMDPRSHRMDYDEEAASVLWEWEGLWGTSTAPLDATDLSSPLFTAPAGSAGEEYHYIASMTTSASGVSRTARRRVTVTVTGVEEAQAATDASGLAYKGSAPVITCEDEEGWENTEDIPLNCVATDAPSDAEYAWTARGSTSGTSELSSTTVLRPTFLMPNNINESNDADKDYEYMVTMTSGGVVQDSTDVTVTVLEKPNITCRADWRNTVTLVGFGSGTEELYACFDEYKGAPEDANGFPAVYVFEWDSVPGVRSCGVDPMCRIVPAEDALAALNRTDGETAIFTPPAGSPWPNHRLVYGYRLTVSAENADPLSLWRHVDSGSPNRAKLGVRCLLEEPFSRYEAVEDYPVDFPLECWATGLWSGYTAQWEWVSTGLSTDTDALSATNVAQPVFDMPQPVDSDKDFVYSVTVSAPDHIDSDPITVTVYIKNREVTIACTDSYSVEEGSGDVTFDCSASSYPPGATIAYAWSSPGAPANTSLLIAGTDGPAPTFDVPDEVPADTDYSYTVTATAAEADAGTATVTVTVLNRGLSIACTDSYSVYESEDDFPLACSASGAAPGATVAYAWSSPGRQADESLLSATDVASPVFAVPNVDAEETYTYTVTATAAGADPVTATVTVTVKNGTALRLVCVDHSIELDEGDPNTQLTGCMLFNASNSGARFRWTPRGDTQDTALLSNPNARRPFFLLMGLDIQRDTTFQYTVTASRPEPIWNDDSVELTVTVRNTNALSVACTNVENEVYEGAEDFDFDCTPSGAPSGSSYTYAWTGDAAALALLDEDDVEDPTFLVPPTVSSDATYEYTLTVSASNARDATVDVEVTVLNKKALRIACTNAENRCTKAQRISRSAARRRVRLRVLRIRTHGRGMRRRWPYWMPTT